MNFEFLSNLVKLFGKKCYYACAVFLIVIQFNKTLEEFFINNKKYFVVLWLFAIIAIIDVIIVFIGLLNNCYLNFKENQSREKYSLNALNTVKLNHKNGIEILYFLFNLPVYGNENCKLINYEQFFKNYNNERIFREIVVKFQEIRCQRYNGIFELTLRNSNDILIFNNEFYIFLKDYFQKNPQEKFDIESII